MKNIVLSISVLTFMSCCGTQPVPNPKKQGSKTSPPRRTQPFKARTTLGQYVDITAGMYHTCAVNRKGKVSCWLESSVLYPKALGTALPTSPTRYNPSPVLIPGLPKVVEVTSGPHGGCARTPRGEIWCWRHRFQAKNPWKKSRPKRVLKDALSITQDHNHTCAIRSSHNVACWHQRTLDNPKQYPVTTILGPTEVVSMTIGVHQSCAVTRLGEIHCWQNSLHAARFIKAKRVLLGKVVKGFYLGFRSTCFIDPKDELHCQKLGATTSLPFSAFKKVTGLAAVKQLRMGSLHSCAVTQQGKILCWGYNGLGQLGIGSRQSQLTPKAVSLSAKVKKIVLGYGHTCALTRQGKVYCWGDNVARRQRFLPTRLAQAPPRTKPLTNVTKIAAGAGHGCAVRQDGSVWCWGRGNKGQLGHGKLHSSLAAVQVKGLTDVRTVATGHDHSCAVTRVGKLYCWGAGEFGQLGSPKLVPRTTPGQVRSRKRFVEVALGTHFTCALSQGGKVFCFGKNAYGLLGLSTRKGPRKCYGGIACSPEPLPIQHAQKVQLLMAKGLRACTIDVRGTLRCWGYDYSKMQSLPKQVFGLPTVVRVALGHDFGCAVDRVGTVYCFGSRESPARPGRHHKASKKPIRVPKLSAGISLSISQYHGCASTQAGTIHCWGMNEAGQRGSGSQKATDQPRLVEGLGKVTQVITGYFPIYHRGGWRGPLSNPRGRSYTCALTQGQKVKCLGGNAEGQLGNGTYQNSPQPTILRMYAQ